MESILPHIQGIIPIIDAAQERDLRISLLTLLYKKLEWSKVSDSHLLNLGFPGTEAYSLSRYDFKYLKSDDYMVCEKTDGVRLIVLIREEGMYLCDRKYKFFFLARSSLFVPTHKDIRVHQNNTVLDCVLTYNFFYDKYCLMIFDVMYISDVKVTGHELETRLAYIGDFVIAPFRKLYNDEAQKDLPFILLGKEYFPISKLKNLTDKISKYVDEEEPSGHRIIFNSTKRYNECNGLIFTNKKRNYKSKKCISLKSWNYFNTLDFEVRVEYKNDIHIFSLYVNNIVGKFSSRILYKYNVKFSDMDKEYILNDLNDKKSAIIECRYNDNESRYIYHKMRCDKSSPDEFQDVVKKFQCSVENIQVKELLSALEVPPKKLSSTTPTLTPTRTPVRDSDEIAETPLNSMDEYSVLESPIKPNDNMICSVIKRKVEDLEEDDTYSLENKKARLH
jgi:hypothetical protein